MPAGRPPTRKNDPKTKAQSRFIKQFSSIAIAQLCQEMDIERKTIYDGKISREKTYWVANRLVEKCFIMFVDYYVATNQDISTLHRVELDWHDKQYNLKIIRAISDISPNGIGKKMGVRASNCANGRTSVENIDMLFEVMSKKIFNVIFEEDVEC